ncbi:MAG: hypothetical protein JW862_07045 [Anaerolineales bacterium]|nr:hypothetical protein [Anaerolineales bacterium]
MHPFRLSFPVGRQLPDDLPLLHLDEGETLLEVWATPFFPPNQDAPLSINAYHWRALAALGGEYSPAPDNLLRCLALFTQSEDGKLHARCILDRRLFQNHERNGGKLRLLKSHQGEGNLQAFVHTVVGDLNLLFEACFIPGVRLRKIIWQDPTPLHPDLAARLEKLAQFKSGCFDGAQIAGEIERFKNLLAVHLPEAVSWHNQGAALDLIAADEAAARELAYFAYAAWSAASAQCHDTLVAVRWL